MRVVVWVPDETVGAVARINYFRLIPQNITQDSEISHRREIGRTTLIPSQSTPPARFRVVWTALLFFIPVSIASAGVLSFIGNMVGAGTKAISHLVTSQNTPLLSAVGGPDADNHIIHELSIVEEEALSADAGPMGTILDIEEEANKGMISSYIVREGDSLARVAQMFGVSVNTILWANGLTRTTPIKVGTELVILPVSGVKHSVKKGDTIASLAKKYKAESEDIVSFNTLPDDGTLEVGTTVIVPNGQIADAPKNPTATRVTSRLRGASGPAYDGYYIRPVDGKKTQGLHGYNGIDFGASRGTPVFASAGGQVIVARSSGYNGGYGQYVVISHDNGTQTLYGHLSAVAVSVGDSVGQGQYIGNVGNTGRSTGPHLHFEVRGAKNPF